MYIERDSKVSTMKSLHRCLQKGLLEGMANDFCFYQDGIKLYRRFPIEQTTPDGSIYHTVYEYTIYFSKQLSFIVRQFLHENSNLKDKGVKVLYKLIGMEMPRDAEKVEIVSIKSSSQKYDLGNGTIIKDDASTIVDLKKYYVLPDGALIAVCHSHEIYPLKKIEFEPLDFKHYFHRSHNFVYEGRPHQQLTNFDVNNNCWVIFYPLQNDELSEVYKKHKHLRRRHIINNIN